MDVILTVCNVLFILAAGSWLGGLVVLALARRVIIAELSGRRTEAGQIVRKLSGIFQKIELVLAGVAWGALLAKGAITGLFGGPAGNWLAADWMQLAMLLLASVAAVCGTFMLSPALQKTEGLLGSYTDKKAQIKVRKQLAAYHKGIETLQWLSAVFVAATLAAGVVALA